MHNKSQILILVLISFILSCKPSYDKQKDFLDGEWIVEDMIVNDPAGILEGEEIILDQKKTKFFFDYGGNVRTPMGKRKFYFKEGDDILVIGKFEYLFEKIDENRFKMHHVRDNGKAEVIYILKRFEKDQD